MSITRKILYYLLMFILVPTVSYAESDVENADDDEDIFVPTREWQVVQKGQKIPRGLHVRINLETGITEAKLLVDSNTKDQALAVTSNTNEDTAEKKENTFRSYAELKKDMDESNLSVKSDVDIVNELLDKHAKLLSNNSNSSDKILTILEDLEYLLHQYDNANEFVRIGGFEKIIYKNLNSTDPNIRKATLNLLGTGVENNAKVQIHSLETGSMDALLRILALDTDISVKKSAVFALGGLLRGFPLAQKKFVNNAGLSVISEFFDKSTNTKLQLKIATLMTDLLEEHSHVAQDTNSSIFEAKLQQYDQVNLKAKLEKHNWCESVKKLLLRSLIIDENDYDSVEKCLKAMVPVLDICVSEYFELKDVLRTLQIKYKKLSDNEAINNNESNSDTNYFFNLYDLCSKIMDSLNF